MNDRVRATDVCELLAKARQKLPRLTVAQAAVAMRNGAALVDIRPDTQRSRDGSIPGAVVICRNVLEWRLDPRSPHRDRSVLERDPIILLCNEGYQSSLAAATIRDFGVNATDAIDGFQRWRELLPRHIRWADSG